MRRMLKVLIPFLAFVPAVSAQAQSLEGQWLGADMGGGNPVIEVAACDEGLCGTIVEVQGDKADQNLVGYRLFWDFKQESDGSYTKGKLKPPGGAPQLKATIRELTDESLTLRACIQFFCRSVTMQRL